VFLVRDGAVATPPRDTPVLPGIVRQTVMDLCETLAIECSDEHTLVINDVLQADEVFLTSSTMGVRPVVRIERHAVADEKPGPITRQLLEAYRRVLDGECGLDGS